MAQPALLLETLSDGNFAEAVYRTKRAGHDQNSPEYWETFCSALVEVARECLDRDPHPGLLEEFDLKLLPRLSAVEVDQIKKFAITLQHEKTAPFPESYKQFEKRLWGITSAVRHARRELLKIRQEHAAFTGLPHPIQEIAHGIAIAVEAMGYDIPYTFDFQDATLLAVRSGQKEATIYELPPVQAVMDADS